MAEEEGEGRQSVCNAVARIDVLLGESFREKAAEYSVTSSSPHPVPACTGCTARDVSRFPAAEKEAEGRGRMFRGPDLADVLHAGLGPNFRGPCSMRIRTRGQPVPSPQQAETFSAFRTPTTGANRVRTYNCSKWRAFR